MELIVENKSNADSNYLKAFYNEVNGLDDKIKHIINSCKIKIILVNKFTDLMPAQKIDKEISHYSENYYKSNRRDELTRGVCSDTVNAIGIFYNNTTIDIIGAILYHEIGHLVDYYKSNNFDRATLSTKEEFINAYKTDLSLHWNEIQQDKRFRLIHYVQNSTPENPSKTAMLETFAHCFARIYGKIDDIDIVNLYFQNSKNVTEKIVQDFLKNIL